MSSHMENPSSQQTSLKSTTYDDFISACGDYDMVSKSSKEKSKRVALNEELKYFKAAVHDFNMKKQTIYSNSSDILERPICSITIVI